MYVVTYVGVVENGISLASGRRRRAYAGALIYIACSVNVR